MDSLLFVGAPGPELKRIKAHLVKQGFRVVTAEPDDLDRLGDGKERFMLAVLDASGAVRLQPLMDQVRAQSFGKDLPLMALLKESQVREVAAFKGLEDFSVVSASADLLEARIRFILSRLNHLPPGTGKKIGGLELNVDRYEVLLNGEPLELTYKEFELFKFLATHPGRVFSRDQLLNQVWGYNFIGGTRTVDVHIRRLRAKLGPKHASLVDTVRNVGYKFLENL